MIFRLRPGLEWKFLLRRTWPGQKPFPLQFPGLFHSLSKGNLVSLVRTFLSEPGSKSKINRLGGWGWKNDPDLQKSPGPTSPESLQKRLPGPSGLELECLKVSRVCPKETLSRLF